MIKVQFTKCILTFGLLAIKLYRCNEAMEKEKEYFRTLPPVDFSLADAVNTDVIYKLFTDPQQEEGTILTIETIANCKKSFDPSKPTVVIIHGWTTDDTSPWYEPLKDEYFKTGPHNVIYVNWSAAGNKTYDVSAANAKPIGRFIAEFLIELGVLLENAHIVGHSLGSQVSGFIGKATFDLTGNKLGRITALDPAGPKWENPAIGPDSRLTATDADFVDVIHTDIQLYGFTAPIGHVDFYPNEGKHQNGCPVKREPADVNCSHARSTLYFIESLAAIAKAREANYEEKNYIVNVIVKDNGKEVIFGQRIDKTARGVFYFKTNSEAPFLIVTDT